MPIEVPRRVRKTYTRERSRLSDLPPLCKMLVYIRLDQAAWLDEEQERRLARKKRGGIKRGRPPAAPPEPDPDAPPADPNAPLAPVHKGRSGKYSEMAREAIDLLIEYSRHAEFMASKLAKGPQRGPAARSPEPAAPGPQSSGNSGQS